MFGTGLRQIGSVAREWRLTLNTYLFRDTPNDDPYYTLATFRDIGAVWGLAYRHSEPAVYAATYHKRALPYGPEGPGAIYRIDLEDGAVTHFATVPDAGARQRGSSMSNGKRDFDRARGRDVGQVALGDMDISTDESQLFVVNLNDTRIYRFEMPGGKLIGSFEHGATDEPWSRQGRPFALAFHDGHLFHGVVNSRGTGSAFVAKIYRSLPDRSNMTPIAQLDLTYRRDGIRLRTVSGARISWGPWKDTTGTGPPLPGPRDERASLHSPQPVLTDLAFTADDEMIIGLRDPYWDIELQWIRQDETLGPTVVSAHQPTRTPEPPRVVMAEEGLGFGDILLGRPEGDGWQVQTDPEHFDDTNALGHAECALGGLAWIPDTSSVAATAYGVKDARSELILGEEGVLWFDVETGQKTGSEAIGRPGRAKPYEQLLRNPKLVFAHTTTEIYQDYEYLRDLGSLGDVEVLCVAGVELPTPTPTDPSIPPTDTPGMPTEPPTPTFTPPPTPTRTPMPRYLPLILKERCDPEYQRADVALVLDTSSSMAGRKLAGAREAALRFVGLMDLVPGRDQVTVVRFDTEAEVVQVLTSDRGQVESAIRQLENRSGTHIAAPIEDGLAPVGMYFSPSLIESAAVHEGAAVMYLADGHAGVLVLDVSDPAAPDLIGSLDTPGAAHDVILDGDRLLVADGPAGLLVLDIADPRSPNIAAAVDTPAEALGIATLGDVAYVADGDSGLRVIDLGELEEVGAIDTPGMAWDVAIGAAHAFVSDRPGGMRVYDLVSTRHLTH